VAAVLLPETRGRVLAADAVSEQPAIAERSAFGR
jgi:hypothetical protein